MSNQNPSSAYRLVGGNARNGGRRMKDLPIRAWCAAQNRVFEIRDSERGATAVEYGIMVALIAAVIIFVVKAVGSKTSNAFESVNKGDW